MSRYYPVELTNLCLVYSGERILVQEKVWHGQKGIVFPGGHIEPGESLTASVIREIREETGLEIERPVLCGVKDWCDEDGSRYIVFLYKTDRFTGELRSSAEGKVFWVDRAQFAQMDVMWEMDKVLHILDSDDCGELFYPTGSEECVII